MARMQQQMTERGLRKHLASDVAYDQADKDT